MAYDGHYPNSYPTGNMNPDLNDPHGYYSPTPPYPSYYEPDHINMPQPPIPQPPMPGSPAQNPEAYPNPPRPPQNNGNIDEAVSSAVHNADSSTYLSPDVLSHITATVIQQLKATGLENIQGSGPPPPPPPQSQPPWPSVDPLLRAHNDSPHSMAPQRSSSIPPPNPIPGPYDPQSQYAPPSGYPADTRSSSQSSPDLPDRHDSLSSQCSDRSAKPETRPKPPSRDATLTEITTLEKIWGKLFEDGKPTKRLGQFLRGIAVHLIEDYPPGNTLVIVPHKLQKFYQDTHVTSDPYPWQDIFDDRTSSISRLFREVQAEHHLVQDKLDERPDIPGLTPNGFEKWATLMVQAHPEREYERLANAVLNMPINNPDDKKERFPKEIPRRLFPEVADLQLREETEGHIMKHCGVDLPHITDEERSQASRSRRSPQPGDSSTERASSYERGRPPPSASTSSSAVVDDEDETVSPAPIERERKPYSAQPGGGKVYDEPSSTHTHTGSFSTTRPADIPGSTPNHRLSEVYERDPSYARSGSGPAPAHRFSRRSRSSSRGVNSHTGDYRHSESDLLGRDHPPRYGGMSTGDLYTESPTSTLPSDDDIRRYREHVPHRGSRGGEEYYRGMLGGQGGGPVHEYKYYR